MTYTTTGQGAGRSAFGSGVRRMLDAVRQDFERHRRFDRTYRELSSLSDRELADIGVFRGNIVDIAWQEANRA